MLTLYFSAFLQECDQYWGEITNGMYWFDRRATLAAVLRSGSVTVDSLVQFFDAFVAQTSTRRCKFSSQFYGAGKRYIKAAAGMQTIQEPCVFRRSQVLLPVPDFAPL